MVVNNWQVIASGYAAVYGSYVYVLFVLFNLLVVTVALNVFTAFFISAFMVKLEEQSEVTLGVASHVRPEFIGRSYQSYEPPVYSLSGVAKCGLLSRSFLELER